MRKNFKLFLFYFSSVFVGIINGIFGCGGGILCVPILKNTLGLTDKEAHASSVLVMALVSIPTFFVYAFKTQFDIKTFFLVTLGVIVGGILGSKLLKKLNNNVINMIFIIITIFAGSKILFG